MIVRNLNYKLKSIQKTCLQRKDLIINLNPWISFFGEIHGAFFGNFNNRFQKTNTNLSSAQKLFA